MFVRKTLPWLAVIAFLSFFFTSCRRAQPTADLTFINGAEPESLDPAIVTGQPEGRLCLALFEGLTSFDAAGLLGPAIAESWDISPDGRTYTFHMRDTRWSNGDPVTADDFVQSWKRVLDPAFASKYVEQLYYVENAEAYNNGKITDFDRVGVKALDPLTLQVRLANPTPFFLDLCAFQTLMPVHLRSIARWGDDWIKPGKLVSNGAYMLEDWRIDDHIRLKANPYYWRKEKVSLQVIDALPISQATTAFNLFYSGRVDLLLDKGLVPPLIIGEIRKQPYFHANPFLGTYFYRFNVKRPPFNDARVRKALALAIDKTRIVEKITRAGEPIAGSFSPPGLPGYTPPAGLSYNVADARRLLGEAGYPEGKGFPKFSILYNNSEVNEQIATEIQAMWHEQLGLQVNLRTEEWKVYLNSMQSLDYDVCRSSWVGDYNDPNTFLGCFLTHSGNNCTGYSSAEYDRLVNEANQQTDSKVRVAMLRQAETILVEKDLPMTPIYYYVGITLYDGTKLGGLEPNVIDEHPLREMYWKKR
jgi:oligopeptide transport system substrate-binding protein